MNKLISVFLAMLCCVITFAFVGCSGDGNTNVGGNSENPSVSDVTPSDPDEGNPDASGGLEEENPEGSGGEGNTDKTDAIKPNGTYQVRTENTYVACENGRIFAVLYFSQGVEGERPAVIFSHGFNNTNSIGTQYARALASQGYIVCCFDYNGGGLGSKSEGLPSQMSALTEKVDLEAVVDMMQTREDVDKNNLFLLGLSQGGVVASLVAAETPDEFAAVVLLSPALVLVDDARARYKSLDEIPDNPDPLMGFPVGKKYYTDILNLDVYGAIKGNNRPTLIFHGTNDDIVNISYSQRAVEELPNAKLETLNGEGHMYSFSTSGSVIEKMSAFMKENLR